MVEFINNQVLLVLPLVYTGTGDILANGRIVFRNRNEATKVHRSAD